MDRPMCRHCGLKVASRPRGLCWKHYYSPARHLYPATPKNRTKAGWGRHNYPCPACGTLRLVSEKFKTLNPVCATCRRSAPEQAILRPRIEEYERRAAANEANGTRHSLFEPPVAA